MASLADAEMAFPTDLTGLATVGVTEMANVVHSPNSSGDVVIWGDRTSPGVWCRTGALHRRDVDCQYVGCVGCDPVGVDCAPPTAGCSSSLVTCSSANSVPVPDYRTGKNWKLCVMTVMIRMKGLTVNPDTLIMMTQGITRGGVVHLN